MHEAAGSLWIPLDPLTTPLGNSSESLTNSFFPSLPHPCRVPRMNGSPLFALVLGSICSTVLAGSYREYQGCMHLEFR